MGKFTLDRAGNYGEVRTVNGITPDRDGNVNVGGADMVLFHDNGADINTEVLRVIRGTIEDVSKKMYAGEFPNILLVTDYMYGGGRITGVRRATTVHAQGGDLMVCFVDSSVIEILLVDYDGVPYVNDVQTKDL